MRVPTSVAMLFMLAAAAPLSAQSSERVSNDSAQVIAHAAQSTTERETVTSLPTSGASMTGLRAGVHARETRRPDQPTMAAAGARGNLGQARAMMVVGVAALITGAIIGGQPGTFIMVGGAVIGLVGLYDYLQ
jgi:hypothetical protein